MNFSEADVYNLANLGTIIISGEKRTFDEPWELDAVLDGWNQYQKDKNACEGSNANKCEHQNIDMYTVPE